MCGGQDPRALRAKGDLSLCPIGVTPTDLLPTHFRTEQQIYLSAKNVPSLSALERCSWEGETLTVGHRLLGALVLLQPLFPDESLFRGQSQPHCNP